MTFTPRQQAIVDFVRGFWNHNDCGPTVEEVGAAVGLSSKASVAYQIKTLCRRGVLTRDRRSRTLRLAPPTHPCRVCRGTGIDPNEEVAA